MKTPSIIRPIRLHTALPEDVMFKVQSYLWSKAENRVPHGAYQKFLIDLINDFFERLSHANNSISPTTESSGRTETPSGVEGQSSND